MTASNYTVFISIMKIVLLAFDRGFTVNFLSHEINKVTFLNECHVFCKCDHRKLCIAPFDIFQGYGDARQYPDHL